MVRLRSAGGSHRPRRLPQSAHACFRLMTRPITIAVDAMGGDFGPSVIVPGCALSLKRAPETRYVLVGKKPDIDKALASHEKLAAASEVVHTDVTVAMDDKPSQALRAGRWKSSMWLALQAVRDGDADMAVSAGNTGALMAMAKFCLKSMPGVERPAIAAIWPTARGESVVLDVGATIGADAEQLVDFAIMGEAMARAVFHVDRPTVGLLNIGVEEVKGLEQIREAGQILRESSLPMRYHGFVEGDDVGRGTVDVVVTEGFAGNIALKTAEGTARQIGGYLRNAMRRGILSRLGYLLAKGAFDTLREKMDPRKVNGGVFLGLNGLVVKSHGGTDAEGFASAVALGIDMVRSDVVKTIAEDFATHRPEVAEEMVTS